MNDQWQDNLRSRMERHEEPAPEGLWNSIEQIMSAETIPAKRNIIPLWSLRIGAAAAAALILFFIGLRTLNVNENREDIQTAEQVQKEHSVPDTPSFDKEPVAKTEEQLLAYRAEERKPASEKLPLTADTNTPAATEKNETTGEENKQQQPDTKTVAPDDKTPSRDPADNRQPQLGVESGNTSGFQLPARGSRHKVAKWQTDVYASNLPSGTTRKHDGYGSFTPYKSPSEEEEFAVAATRSTPSGDIPTINEYQHVYTDIRHDQPITLGVSMKYNLDERWSLTSGLTYTILSSQLRSGTDNHYYNSRQTLHYVGIPLNVNYTVWGNDKVSTYVSGGGLVEKNVSGTLSTDFVIDNKLETQSRKEISVKQLQWSVNSAVGIQYQVAKNIGIYAEPGVAYHFKNNSDVETIYKEKPLNFNIRLGLRFSLNE